MHILVTNDDGVRSPALPPLFAALSELWQVTVLAPEHNWSAAGHNKTMHKPMRVDPAKLSGGEAAFACNGTPSDCVGLAVLGVLEHPVDLVVSGINLGANLGLDVTYSGTAAGAMEAAISGLPALAVSIATFDANADFRTAAAVTKALVEVIIHIGLPHETFLNVNVPPLPWGQLRGLRLTHLGRRIYRDVLLKREDPRGRPYYWVGGEPPTGNAEPGTDIWAVENGYVSVTPIQMDMTAYSLLQNSSVWEAKLAEVMQTR